MGFGAQLKNLALTGEWDRALKMIGSKVQAEQFFAKAKKKAISRAAAYATRQIVLNMNSRGVLAGAPFEPLAESTIAKRVKGKGTGGHKPLIDTDDLRGSVHPHVLSENVAFVGVKRGSIGKKTGEPRGDIAFVMEYGAVVKRGKTTTVIPARPFVGPVLEKFGPEMGKVYAKSLEKDFEGQEKPETMPELEIE